MPTPQRTPQPWAGTAWNPVPHSENEIHGDDVAQQHGFRGGLVPGVCVSALLMHPAVAAWGLDWLSRGRARARCDRPLYDGDGFEVELFDVTDRSYRAELHSSEGRHRAVAHVELPDEPEAPPVRRGDPLVSRESARPKASRAVFERMQREGMPAVPLRWFERSEITSYLRDAGELPEANRADGGRHANPAFVLGMTNWALSRCVGLNPWLHLETEHRNHAPIPWGSEVVIEQAVGDLFEKKGHEFVDVEVAGFLGDGTAVMSGRLRAIYRLRGS